MKECIRKNFILGLGILLPVAIMGVFFLSDATQKLAAPGERPHYNLLLSAPNAYSVEGQECLLFVAHNTLRARCSKVARGSGMVPKLYMYDAQRGKLRQLDFPPPDAPNTAGGNIDAIVDATKTMKIDTGPESPDGFTFSYGGEYSSGSGGIVGELFMNPGNREWGPRIHKANTVILLKPDMGYDGYSQLQPIGWVIPASENP